MLSFRDLLRTFSRTRRCGSAHQHSWKALNELGPEGDLLRCVLLNYRRVFVRQGTTRHFAAIPLWLVPRSALTSHRDGLACYLVLSEMQLHWPPHMKPRLSLTWLVASS